MKKRKNNRFSILITVLVVIILGFLLLKFLPKPLVLVPTPEQRVEQLLSPALQTDYSPPASLQNNSFYRAGFTPAETLKSYMLTFTNDKNYTDAYQYLIQFQQGLNGIGLNSALEIDKALAESLAIAAANVESVGENDKEACSYFNSLLNPSLLVMDLTLWTGKSEIYSAFQKYRNIGIQCEFYFPALQHGMFTYDVRTGKMVQRTLFCDPSEGKVKCFSVWNYFWKFAADPAAGAVNYGAGCSLTDWMRQGFVCVNGIDLRGSTSGIRQLKLKYYQYLKIHDQIFPLSNSSYVVEEDVTDSFHNAPGASGRNILNNVKRKCSQIKDKASLYGNLAAGISDLYEEGSSSITGGVVGIDTTLTETEEDLQQQYEKAMLFASLFSEACMQDFSNLGNSLGGGIDSLGGRNLNTPLSCIISDLAGSGSSQLRETVECFAQFGQQQKMGALLSTSDSVQGIPDPKCKMSDARASKEALESLTPPSPMEKTLYEGLKGKSDFRVVDTNLFPYLCETCNKPNMGAFTPIAITKDENGNTIEAKQDGPIIYKEGYQYDRETIKHEEWHASCPQCTEEQVKELTKKGEDPPKKTVTPAEAKKYCKDCTTLPDEKPKEGYPEPEGEDACSANAQRIEAFLNCMEPKSQETFSQPPGNRPTPDPAPDDVGQDITSCAEAVSAGGMFSNPVVGSRDDCMFGDQDCNIPGAYYGGIIQGKINKKCQYAQDDSGLQCPSDLGMGTGVGMEAIPEGSS